MKREKLAFDDPEALQQLISSNNSRLKLIERTAGAEVHLRGNEITIEGGDRATDTAKSALEQLYALALAGKPLSSDDVVRAVKLLQGEGTASIGAVFGHPDLVAPRGPADRAEGRDPEALRRPGPHERGRVCRRARGH